MKPGQNLREFLYPAEWCFRFAVIAFLMIIINSIYPGQFLLNIVYYTSIAGIVVGLLLQFTYVNQWMKENKENNS
ncbi:MAG: hypothetical protein JXQ82_02950 [Methanomicrobiaceae archaeon]|nr:hypothetical protein [Methanomicrobiaceae archaeon]